MAQDRAVRLVVTLGPSSLRPAVLRALPPLGVDLLRVNLSHVAAGDVESVLRSARVHSHLPVCVDTEGAQVRVGLVATGVALRVGQPVFVSAQQMWYRTDPELSVDGSHASDTE